MNLICIICSDGIAPSAEVFATYCGHLFHYHCLIQWIERSKTCPQCRSKSTEKTIHRVYFNQANLDGNTDDLATLQSKVDNLQFQLMLKGKDVTSLTEKYNKVKQQNITLREEVCELTNKSRSHDSTVHALKDQISFYKVKTKERDKLAEELTKLKTTIKQMETVDLVVNGSREAVNEMLRNENDIGSLTIMVASLKRALMDAEQKKINMEHRFNQLKQELTKYRKDINLLELSNKELKTKILSTQTALERDAVSKTLVGQNQSSDTTEHSVEKNRLKSSPILQIDYKKKLPVVESPSVDQHIDSILQSNSPYLCLRSGNSLVQEKPKYLSKSAYPQQKSILKISRQASNIGATKPGNAYNGLGGQSKEDIFPSAGAKRHRLDPCAYSTKFRKLDSVMNCKK